MSVMDACVVEEITQLTGGPVTAISYISLFKDIGAREERTPQEL
jgi:hypothetical protein